MKVVKVKGGLGNQLFQYAFAKLLEKKTKEEVLLDFSSFLCKKQDQIRQPRIMNFALSLRSATKDDINAICLLKHGEWGFPLIKKGVVLFESKFNKKYYLEPNRAFVDLNSIINYSFFDGYWQSWRYVDEVKKEVLKDFVPQKPLSKKSTSFIDRITGEEAVFIGVRRGDYSQEIRHYGQLDISYYKTAMDRIAASVSNPIFYVFSNDIEWCRDAFSNTHFNVVFREQEDQFSDFEELIIMSNCRHAIISNSTFNWWGAELIDNPQKIVCCPSKWFFDDKPIDIIRREWIRIVV